MQDDRIEFLGCDFDSVTEDEAIERVFDWRDESRESRLLLTINVSILMMLRSDERLRDVCRRGELVVADGVPIVWGTKLLGEPLAARVSGCDLMARLLEAGNQRGLRVFFLGAKEEVIAKLVEIVERDYPGVTVAGCRNGYFTPDDWPDVTRQIRESNADALFIGMPTPFKEIWADDHREELNTPAIIPVGGSFDVIAGFVRRAPKWMQKCGMEWFWRLMMEPRKLWKRYLVTNTQFMFLFAGAFVGRLFGFRRKKRVPERELVS